MIRPIIRRLAVLVALPARLALLPAAPTQAAVRLKPPILVRVAQNAKLGPILVKANGRTLYYFSRDHNGKIGCTGACLQFWFPLLVAKGTKLAAVAPGLRTGLGVIKRGAGQLQLTYKHPPLYTFYLGPTGRPDNRPGLQGLRRGLDGGDGEVKASSSRWEQQRRYRVGTVGTNA